MKDGSIRRGIPIRKGESVSVSGANHMPSAESPHGSCRWRVREDARVRQKIQIFHEVSCGTNGISWIQTDLAVRDACLNRKGLAARLMPQEGLREFPRYKAARAPIRKPRNHPVPHLAGRDFSAAERGSLRTTNIAHTPHHRPGPLFPAVAAGLPDNRVVGWAMVARLANQFAQDARDTSFRLRPKEVVRHHNPGFRYPSLALGHLHRLLVGILSPTGPVRGFYDNTTRGSVPCGGVEHAQDCHKMHLLVVFHSHPTWPVRTHPPNAPVLSRKNCFVPPSRVALERGKKEVTISSPSRSRSRLPLAALATARSLRNQFVESIPTAHGYNSVGMTARCFRIVRCSELRGGKTEWQNESWKDGLMAGYLYEYRSNTKRQTSSFRIIFRICRSEESLSKHRPR